MTQDDLAAVELRTLMSAWRALARRWDLTPRELLELFPAGGQLDTNPPQDTEARMRIMVEISYRIGLPEAILRDWLRTPSLTLGWLTPLDVMSGALGDLRGFRRLIEMGFAS